MTRSIRTLSVVAAAAAFASVLGAATAAAETPAPAPVAPVAASPVDAALHAVVTSIPGLQNTSSVRDLCHAYTHWPPEGWEIGHFPADPCGNLS